MLGRKVKIFLAFLAFQQSGLKLLTANPANYSLSLLQTAKLQKLAPFKSQHNQLKLLRFPTPKATAEFPPILEPNHPMLKSTPFLYNKFMTETKPVKLKTQNLKTETCASSKFGQVQLGKLVRLPYIRKVSTKITNPSVSRKSLENKQPRVVRHSNKESHLFEQTQLNMLTLQEIELCNHSSKQKDHHKDTFPRISQNNPLLCREKSRDSLEGTFKDHFDPSLTKTDFLEHIRDYKLGPVIGRGTYSVVRSARNKQGKRVAIKTYLKTSLSNEDRRKNLQNEISVLESVNHPCILSYLETVQTETSLNIVSELLQISSLAEYIKTQYLKTVPQDIAKFIYKQLVKAVAYLHANDIVHRDIKLENVLVSKEFKIKIIDFGFSRQLPKENHVLYDFCGTMHYIAPEVMQREGYYGKPADIWALGVLLYRMTVGCFPFKGLNQKTLYTKVMKAELKLPFQLSSELSNLLTNLLNFDFRRRPTADQILGCDWIGK